MMDTPSTSDSFRCTATMQPSRTDILQQKRDTEQSDRESSNTVEWICETDNFWFYQGLSFYCKFTDPFKHLLQIHKLWYLKTDKDTKMHFHFLPHNLIDTAPYFKA